MQTQPESSIIATTFGSAFIVGKTNIFTCNSLNVFAGSFTKSADWFPVVSFLLFFEILLVSMQIVFWCLYFSEVGILYWRNTNIFTCNRLNVFAGPFTESVDWFPVVSFLLFFEIFWFRRQVSFDACIFRSRNTLLKRYRFVCYEKVAIRKWRKYHVVQRSISVLVVMILNHKTNICCSIQRTNEEYT